MLIIFLFKFLSSTTKPNYFEITEQNKKEFLRGTKPILVKFYSPNCEACQEMEEPFNQASQYFEDALFGGINCPKESSLCEEEKVLGTPTVKLYLNSKKDPIEYDGDYSMDSFIDFIEENTYIRSFRPPKPLRDLNPYSFQSFIKQKHCNFVKFYKPPNNFIPTLKKIAQAFESDLNVSFGMVNCDKFPDICEKNADAPIILYRNGRRILYNRKSKESIETEEKVLKFINRRCHTERGIDGLIIDTAGQIREANKIAKEFIRNYARDSNNIDKYVDEAILKMSEVEDSEVYINVLERIKKNGLRKLQEDIQKMFDVMYKKEGSQKVLDSMKRRYNVMVQFLPKSALPLKEDLPKNDL